MGGSSLYGASLSRAVFSILVMRLVEQGKNYVPHDRDSSTALGR